MQARGALFALMLALSLAVLISSAAVRQRGASAASVPLEAASADLAARLAIAQLTALPPDGAPTLPPMSRAFLDAALQQYHAAYQSHPEAVVLALRIGILLEPARGPQAARDWFGARPTLPHTTLWQAAYGSGALSADQLRAALRQVDSADLAWYGELVRRRLYRNAGQEREAQAVFTRLKERLRPGARRALTFSTTATLALLAGVNLWLLLALRRAPLPRVPGALPFSALSSRQLGEVFVLWFFTYSVGGWLLRRVVPGLSDGGTMSLTDLLLTQLALQVFAAVVGVALLVEGLRRNNALETPPPEGAGRPSFPANVTWGILTYVAAVPLILITAGLLSRLLPRVPSPPNPAASLGLAATGFWEWALLFGIAVVAAPIIEELFFRGVLYTALRKHAGVPLSVLGSAAAFALVHPQLPLGFLPILVLGALFAYVLELRRSLVPCVVAHLLNNAVALFLISLMRTP